MMSITELLTGSKLVKCGRCLNLIWLHFLKDDVTYCLHCQCLVRMYQWDKLLVSSHDVFYPDSSFIGDVDLWDWSECSKDTLFDEELSNAILFRLPLCVENIQIKRNMDIVITLSNDYQIEISVITLTDDESWRFFKHFDANSMTMVYSGRDSYAIGISQEIPR